MYAQVLTPSEAETFKYVLSYLRFYIMHGLITMLVLNRYNVFDLTK